MLFNLKNQLSRALFKISIGGILKTKPIDTSLDHSFALLTQLQHKDVLLAIVAFKSFIRQIPVGSVYVLNDGSLTDHDINLLKKHLPAIKLLAMKNAHSKQCPKGGCWERLLSIANLVKDHYVIQLDSDTLTLDNIPEISECIKNNQSFVIGTWDDQDFESMPFRQGKAAALISKSELQQHIQLSAEANFNKLQRFETLKYVRGCAGFTGFAKGSFDKGFVEEISAQMSKALGERWNEWGSEQVMSNIVVANSPNVRVLPHPKYCDCTRIQPGKTVFIHFIGSCRFTKGIYSKLARKVIANLAI